MTVQGCSTLEIFYDGQTYGFELTLEDIFIYVRELQ